MMMMAVLTAVSSGRRQEGDHTVQSHPSYALDSFVVKVVSVTRSISIEIKVRPTDTIHKLKERVAQEYDVLPEEQVISTKQYKILTDDDCTVEEYGITENDVLVVSMAFRAAGVDGEHEGQAWLM